MSDAPHPLDVVDTDPTRLAARTLVEQLRATIYNEDVPPSQRTWWRYVLDEPEAADLVMTFAREVIARHDRQLATQKARGR